MTPAFGPDRRSRPLYRTTSTPRTRKNEEFQRSTRSAARVDRLGARPPRANSGRGNFPAQERARSWMGLLLRFEFHESIMSTHLHEPYPIGMVHIMWL